MKIKDIIFQMKNVSFDEVLEYIIEKSTKQNEKVFLVTVNPEIVMLARRDTSYEKILRSADLAIADGVGVLWAAKLFGHTLRGRIHGVDLVSKVSEAIAKKPITVGFLGGYGNVAHLSADCLKKKYPGLKVAFAASEWPGLEAGRKKVSSSRYKVLRSEEEINNTEYLTPDTSIDILFVAFGSPKQEKWIYENLPKIDVKVAIGVGGAFDFISGKVPRAPKWIRKIGMEWLFRLIIQPWRIKRQLELPKFVGLVLKERLF